MTPTIGASASFDAKAYLEPKISMDVNNVVRGYLNTVSSTITANVGGELGLNVHGENIGPRKRWMCEKRTVQTMNCGMI